LRLFLIVALVAEHCPQDVDAAAGDGEDGLVVPFAFGALAGRRRLSMRGCAGC
jgi:hypothetical protein